MSAVRLLFALARALVDRNMAWLGRSGNGLIGRVRHQCSIALAMLLLLLLLLMGDCTVLLLLLHS